MNYLKRTWAEIDIDALLHNLKVIKENANCDLAAVVKADAYGHGATTVAPIFEGAGVSMFAVSNIEEGIELRRHGIKAPVLILGYTPSEYVSELVHNNFIQTVYSLSYAESLNAAAEKENVSLECHLKVDSGMSRLGFDCRDKSLREFEDMQKAAALPSLSVTGVFTHFSSADSHDEIDTEYTALQYSLFYDVCEKLEKSGIKLACKHCCNSAGTMLNADKHMNMCRPGIILYGLTPADGLRLPYDLKPAMSFKSTVSMVKTIRKGDSVSYGRHFVAESDMTVATVAVGYADGYPRALSCKGSVVINGRRAPILGNVCMDQMMVDISGIENVSVGNEVTLFGTELPVEEVASLCGTINYEIICGVSRRVPRIYIKNGSEAAFVDRLLDE